MPCCNWNLIVIVQQLSASVWLLKLQAQKTRLSTFLLSASGLEGEEFAWDDLWHSACIYVCVRARPARTSLGPLVYVGETVNMSRRFREHVTRTMACFSVTQQPFYCILCRFSTDDAEIKRFFVRIDFFAHSIFSL